MKSSSPFMAKVSIVEGLSLVVCQSILIFLSVQVGHGCFGSCFKSQIVVSNAQALQRWNTVERCCCRLGTHLVHFQPFSDVKNSLLWRCVTERGWPYYRGGSKARFHCINLTVYYAGALCRVSLHRVLEYCKWNKTSQVECPFLVDGIMVQMMPDAITKLRSSLKEMKDYTITTGIPGGGGEEEVIVEWVSRKDAPRQSRYKTRVYSELCLWWGPCGH